MIINTHINEQRPNELIVFCNGWQLDRIKCLCEAESRVFTPEDSKECRLVQTFLADTLHCTSCNGDFALVGNMEPNYCPLCGSKAVDA